MFDLIRQRIYRRRHVARAQAYRATFFGDSGALHPMGEQVLAHLRVICFANKSSHVPGDPYTTAFYEGRRDVWNQIIGYLELDDKTIIQLTEGSYDDDTDSGDD